MYGKFGITPWDPRRAPVDETVRFNKHHDSKGHLSSDNLLGAAGESDAASQDALKSAKKHSKMAQQHKIGSKKGGFHQAAQAHYEELSGLHKQHASDLAELHVAKTSTPDGKVSKEQMDKVNTSGAAVAAKLKEGKEKGY